VAANDAACHMSFHQRTEGGVPSHPVDSERGLLERRDNAKGRVRAGVRAAYWQAGIAFVASLVLGFTTSDWFFTTAVILLAVLITGLGLLRGGTERPSTARES
jgi:hypothetical protein